ncbi:unnamed protein product [Mytilus edulis]|uniref:Uncharacterized protein n=1 Tax=Mytilus edulis TaxID=6550 RepID=A0A8S3U8C6_MYTED|nr:unnamed protein product [Mytilus edulis]
MYVSNNSERQRKFHHRLKSLMDMEDINGIEQHNYEMTAAFEIEITEVQSQSLTYINTIDTDQLAEALIPGDVPTRNIRAVKQLEMGTVYIIPYPWLCLVRKETYSDQLRLLTSCELYLNADYYASHPKLNECLQNPIMSTSNPNTLFSYILSDEGDTEFMKSKDRISVVRYEYTTKAVVLIASSHGASVNHQTKHIFDMTVIERQYFTRTNLVNNKTVHILWSRDGNLDNTPRAAYHPNHFVYIHKIYDNVKDNNELENQSDNKKKDEVEQPPLKKQKTFQVKIDAWFQKKITQIKNDAQAEKKEQISTQEEEKKEQISDSHIQEKKKNSSRSMHGFKRKSLRLKMMHKQKRKNKLVHKKKKRKNSSIPKL